MADYYTYFSCLLNVDTPENAGWRFKRDARHSRGAGTVRGGENAYWVESVPSKACNRAGTSGCSAKSTSLKNRYGIRYRYGIRTDKGHTL